MNPDDDNNGNQSMHSVLCQRDCKRNQNKLIREIIKQTFVFSWEGKIGKPRENLLRVQNLG